MIVLDHLTKTFVMHGHRKTVADNLNVTFPTGVSVGLLGANGAGKSTLLKLIAGTSAPTSGRVLSTGSVSFPVGLASSLHADLTGAQNTRFVARIYGADTDALMDWVEEFAELGEHFHLPVRSYSSGMRGRLSFGINMGLAFDTYLIDEITAVGDAAFKRKSSDVFHARMETAGAIFVSHSISSIRELCEAGALLENGKLHYYDDVEEAIERYLVSLDPDRAHPVRTPKGERSKTRFPDEARMLYLMGLPATHASWVTDCLRRFRACHFGPTHMIHYFDVRAGRSDLIFTNRTRSLEELAARFANEAPAARAKTLGLMGRISDLLKIHAAPRTGEGRHNAYLDYLTTRFSGQAIICDPTPDYARLGEADFTEMAEIGDAGFCVVLRDPVDRLWESLCMDLPREERRLKACLAAAQELVEAGPVRTMARQPYANYARLLEVMDATVAKARQIVLFHERLADPARREAELARVTSAYDLPDIPPPRLAEMGPSPRIPDLPEEMAAALTDLLAPQYAAMRARFGDALPAEWRPPGPAERALAETASPQAAE
ncbi:ABC-type polysaccharide/polyol phosphate transport system, ATPase component [Jannaschia seohaensis]|uniref:ABC-type polysaccharide/polyol phosphate transport system ATPase subunit n=1 Tax=Jannaschia seohaensis TaxID=475081 RepID=A0A2Y9B2P5_9RHOB|nr:ABC-type polysaccharide/polyol phosphate transport system ATPase subunit [Jannaschia seohaensis]SSA50721.1 ABC-type polysaccharide/polyol phosphate transport system, ATPase component [Jannaschia seohaensis]